MNKKTILILVALLIIVALAGIYLLFHTASEQTKVLKIGYLNIVASLPLFVAEEKGFLSEEGIRYETIPMASSNQLVDGVLSGNIDCFIESSALPVLAAELQSPGKIKVFSVSEITSAAPFDALLVKKDSSVHTLSDLASRRIGVFPGSTATNLLKKYLNDKGIDTSHIIFIPIPPQIQLAALIKGSIDVLHAYEPTTAIALGTGEIRNINSSVYAEMLSPNPQGVAAINSNFINDYPIIALKAISALERSMIYMKAHDKETRHILITRMKLSEEDASRCVFLYMLPHKQINISVFQKYADMLTELGELNGKVLIKNLIYVD